jgi:hypothetical protein
LRRLLEEKDARIAEKAAVIAEKAAVVAEKEARLQQVVAEKEARLQQVVAEKDARLQQVVAEKDARLQQVVAEKEARLQQVVAVKDARLEERAKWYADALAHAKHETDIAYGAVTARSLFELCVNELYKNSSPAKSEGRATTQSKVERLLATDVRPDLLDYLDRAAHMNNVRSSELRDALRRMYANLSARLHAPAPSDADSVTRVPSEVFGAASDVTTIALAALVRFTGRKLELYSVGEDRDIPLPLPPPLS